MSGNNCILVLMGIKHCGKSTQGRLIARKFHVPFYDTDDVIKKQTGLTAREIYSSKGAEAFMASEADACSFIISQAAPLEKYAKNGITAVVATGGGICNNAKAINLLKKNGKFVFLKAEEKIAADRIVREAKILEDGTPANLPAYIAKKNPRSIEEVRDYFHSFYEERSVLYTKLADVTVTMLNAGREVNLNRILKALEEN